MMLPDESGMGTLWIPNAVALIVLAPPMMLALPEARILGSITLPFLFPHIGTGLLLVLLLVLTNYAVPGLSR